MANKNDYLNMQNAHYEEYAKAWSLSFRDPVVGSYEGHNKWSDYDDYLFKNFDTGGLVALEYGCGPARNLIKFRDRFARVDGIDIAQTNLDKAKINLDDAGIKEYKLYLTSGDNLSEVLSESYDVVFAVICFQHICVYEIRHAILKDIYRVLKPGGYLSFQMGYGGKDGIPTADYFDNVNRGVKPNPKYLSGKGSGKSLFLEALMRWISIRGIKPKDYKGKGRYSKTGKLGLALAIRKNIFRYGIKPAGLIDKTYDKIEDLFENPPAYIRVQLDELGDAIAQDISNLIDNIINE